MGIQPRQLVELNSSSARFPQAQPGPLTSKQTINPSLQQQLQQQRLSSQAQAQSQIRYTRQDICEQYVQPRRQQQQRAHQGNETSKSPGARKVRRAELNVSSCDSDDTACGFGATNSLTADGTSGLAADQRGRSATSTSRRKIQSSREQQKVTHKGSQRKSLPRGIHLFKACLDSNSPHSSSQDLDFEQADENVEPVSAGKRFLTRLGLGCATSSKRRPRTSNSMQALSSVSTTDQQVGSVGNEQRSTPRSQTVSNLRELAINNANDNAYANPALGTESSSSALTASNIANQRNKHVSFEGLVGRTPAGFVQPAAATSALQLQLQPQLPLYSGASTSSSAFPVFVKQPQQPLEHLRQQQLPAATALAQRLPAYLTNTVRQGPLAEQKLASAACVTTTVYKKLPSLPMKTQATQTDITAYHLSGALALNETQTSASAIGSPFRVELEKSPTSSKPIVVKTNPIQHGQNQITALSSLQSSEKPTVTTTTILTSTIATITTTTTTTATTLTTTPSLSSADLPPSISSASSKVERQDSFAKIKLNASQDDDDDDDDERDFDLDLRIKMRDEDDELVEASQNLAATLATPTSSSASSRRSSQGSAKSLEAHDVAIGAARAAQLAKLTVKTEDASKKEALTPSSPPSLSEASSQTNDDIALTTRMRQVQRALTTAGLEYTQAAASSRDGLLGSNKHVHNVEARILFSKANHASLDQSAQSEHRRDEFLRGLEASSETKTTQRTSSFQSQDEKTEPNVSPKRHERQPSDRPRTSTSTLSTRHHSYCSSGELLPASSGSAGGNVVATGSISPEASLNPLPMDERSDAISTAALTLSQLDSNSSNVTSIPEASANVCSEHSLPSSANREPLDDSSSHCSGQNATIQNSTNSSFSAEALPVNSSIKSSKSSKSSSPGVTPTRDGEIQELTQTTVSELSGANSSSSPSFADTYKRKIEQVHEFAAEVTAKLITECLRESDGRSVETKNSVVMARCDQEPRLNIESSNLERSSLIVEQKQEHQIKPTRQKPKLMVKPAHLRASAPKEIQLQRQDAAAAVSVTATSIAAAAARVQAQVSYLSTHYTLTQYTSNFIFFFLFLLLDCT